MASRTVVKHTLMKERIVKNDEERADAAAVIANSLKEKYNDIDSVTFGMIVYDVLAAIDSVRSE